MSLPLLLLFLLLILNCYALPGLSPVTYCEKPLTDKCNSKIDVYSNRLDSLSYIMPYNPTRFDQCPTMGSSMPDLNLGQLVFGERLSLTKFDINFNKLVNCKELCRKFYSPEKANSVDLYTHLFKGITHRYRHNWVADNLPVIVCVKLSDGKSEQCSRNIPLGCFMDDSTNNHIECNLQFHNTNSHEVFLFNHFNFEIQYSRIKTNQEDGIKGNIISVRVNPLSISHDPNNLNCLSDTPMRIHQELSKPLTVVYTYSVSFEELNDRTWASRWDYLLSPNSTTKIQWLSIFNSIIIVLFLTGLIALILIRTLKSDLSRYNKLDITANETQEEFGWKLVHGDVFRAPNYPMLLSVCVGSGIQLALMSIITLFFGCFGILSPAHRGAFATCALALFVCLGWSAGYASARLYKFFGGANRKNNVVLTAVFCPGITFIIFLFLNTILSVLHSSTAVSFTTILALLAMWLGVSLPLCAIGSFFGFRKQTIKVPTRTNQIPRQIPTQTCYSHIFSSMVIGGMLPFGCIFIQLFFILNSIWGSQLIFVFGLIYIVFIILLVSVSETAILLCYFNLCTENYKWFWRSFVCGGSTALYFVIYSFHYYVSKTAYSGLASAFLFFSYTAIVGGLLFIMLGSIGFLACFWFVKKIYAAIKVD